MKVLDAAGARRVPWKNGLGSTLEVASDAAAPGGEWTWRLSIADVPSRSRFSNFPGIDRCLACLTGPGLSLERLGATVRVPREGRALAFSGEEEVFGEPLGPGVRDVNLMLRRDCWRGRMFLVRGGGLALVAPLVLVHAPEGSIRALAAEGPCDLSPGSTLVASGRVAVSVAPGSAAVACELEPV